MLQSPFSHQGKSKWHGFVYQMSTSEWARWPKRVVIAGLKASSVPLFPGRHQFVGVLSIHHDLQVMLPVQSLACISGPEKFCAVTMKT